MNGDLFIAGVWSAKALVWGENRPHSREKSLLGILSWMSMVVVNTGSTSAFRTLGYRETILDISPSSENLAARITSDRRVRWSDHQQHLSRAEYTFRCLFQIASHQVRHWNIRCRKTLFGTGIWPTFTDTYSRGSVAIGLCGCCESSHDAYQPKCLCTLSTEIKTSTATSRLFVDGPYYQSP